MSILSVAVDNTPGENEVHKTQQGAQAPDIQQCAQAPDIQQGAQAPDIQQGGNFSYHNFLCMHAYICVCTHVYVPQKSEVVKQMVGNCS